MAIKSWDIYLITTLGVLCESYFIGGRTASHVDGVALTHHCNDRSGIGPNSTSWTAIRMTIFKKRRVDHHKRNMGHQYRNLRVFRREIDKVEGRSERSDRDIDLVMEVNK